MRAALKILRIYSNKNGTFMLSTLVEFLEVIKYFLKKFSKIDWIVVKEMCSIISFVQSDSEQELLHKII